MRALILRYSSLGDIILATPVLDTLKDRYLGIKIDWIVHEKFKDAIIKNRKIDRVFTFHDKKSLSEVRDEIAGENYDFVFDLHINGRTRFITKIFENVYRYNKRVWERFKLVYFKSKYDKIIPVPHLYFSALRKAGFTIPLTYKPSFYIDKDVEKAVLKRYRVLKDFIVVAPGASYFTKMWPKEYFKKVLDKLNYTVVILGYGEEENRVARFISQGNIKAYDLCGKLSLEESAVFIKRAKAMLTNDSGLMHIAQCFRTPVVAIYGSTTEEFGFFPYATEHTIHEVSDLSCRPCTHFGKKRCPKGHFRCMLEISPKDVYESLERYI
jgi:heptosyltransferase-2